MSGPPSGHWRGHRDARCIGGDRHVPVAASAPATCHPAQLCWGSPPIQLSSGSRHSDVCQLRHASDHSFGDMLEQRAASLAFLRASTACKQGLNHGPVLSEFWHIIYNGMDPASEWERRDGVQERLEPACEYFWSLCRCVWMDGVQGRNEPTGECFRSLCRFVWMCLGRSHFYFREASPLPRLLTSQDTWHRLWRDRANDDAELDCSFRPASDARV
mmetsp:Transcript_136328/g.436252  ORF Transcript_136328/g.436252 Transcript_136328/m.436252 type:complete len:216 (+) Transcript_136328:115-762(+)